MFVKLKSVLSHLTNIVLIGALLFMVFVFIASRVLDGAPEIFGYELKMVLSGSMEPAFKTGSVIAVKPAEDPTKYQKGDVITFLDKDGQVVTHRIVEVIQKNAGHTLYRTKGDNNDFPDGELVLAENVLAQWTGFTIPNVGYLFNFISSKLGIILLMIVPGVMLLLHSIVIIWQTISRMEEKTEGTSSGIEKSV